MRAEIEVDSKIVPPPSKLLLTRRIRVLGKVASELGCDAAKTVGTVLRVWCKVDYAALPNPSLPFSRELSLTPEVASFVVKLRDLDFLEAIYWLSSTYALLTDQHYRKQLAMYFTPVSLTKGLLDELAEKGVDFGNNTFLDPACGGAAFLAPVALRIRTALLARGFKPRQVLKHVETHVFGTDMDKTLCELSKHFLYMALHSEVAATGSLPRLEVHHGDSLSHLASRFGKVDVVVCNPPYRKMRDHELRPLRAQFGEVIDSQPNLYGLFIALCVRLLRVDGFAALVTPTSFLSGQYFVRLRKFLMRHVDIEHIGMISDRLGVFIDVSQETALTVLRRRKQLNKSRLVASVSVVSRAGLYESVGECILHNSGSAWPIPRSVEDVSILKRAARSKFRISDYGYRVRIGAYVWNRDKRPKYATTKRAKQAKAHAAVPLLWSRDISAGGVVSIARANGSETKTRFVDLGDKAHRSIVTQPSLILQRVTSNDQPRRLVAAIVAPRIFEVYGGFVGENHVVILEQVSDKPLLAPTQFAALLGSRVIDRCFRCLSGSTNVSAFELNQLALPNPTRLSANLAGGLTMNDAVSRAFGIPITCGP